MYKEYFEEKVKEEKQLIQNHRTKLKINTVVPRESLP